MGSQILYVAERFRFGRKFLCLALSALLLMAAK